MDCPICLHQINCAVVASCGHSFCAECILSCSRQDSDRPIVCPICRSNISLLISNFGLRSVVGDESSDNSKSVEKKIYEYNMIFNGDRNMANIPRESLVVLRESINRNIMQKIIVFSLIGTLLIYLLLPWDLIPEVMGLIGFVDDILIALLIFTCLWILAEKYREDFLRQQPFNNDDNDVNDDNDDNDNNDNYNNDHYD